MQFNIKSQIQNVLNAQLALFSGKTLFRWKVQQKTTFVAILAVPKIKGNTSTHKIIVDKTSSLVASTDFLSNNISNG